MANEREFSTPSGGDLHSTRTVSAEDRPTEHRIGPYRILRELGHGGMGTVYLALRADEQFHKRVALKVIRSGSDVDDVVRHFKRERQILASLDHPNIAKLLDGGTTEDGLPSFVMEYIEGEPLLGYCDARSLPVPERLRLFQSVCAAVQYAHRNLVVHRDIKPGNILVAADGLPRLLDFGIAKLLNSELAGEAPTATAMAMTPEYASPEQARGERITTATDVYSLGVVLYELLTGHHPYRLASRQPLDVLKAISEQEPERPSTAVDRSEVRTAPEGTQPVRLTPEAVARTREGTPEKLKRRLRGDLDNILMLALRKEPQRRYASVEAFSDDVRRYLDGLPVKARRPTVSYRAGKFASRHVVGVAAAAVLVVLLIGFGLAVTMQRDMAQRERATAQRERETAERVSSFLVGLFKVADPSEARGNAITAREVLDKGAEKIATELKDEPEVRATLMDTLGTVYLSLGLYDRALPLLQEALKTRKTVLGGEHVDVARSLSNVAHVLYMKGDHTAAEAHFREALAVRRRLFGDEHPEVAKALNNLGLLLGERGDYAEATSLHRQALASWRKALGNEHPHVAMSLNNLAGVLGVTGNHAEAESLYREALAIWRRLLGNEHPDVARGLSNLAAIVEHRGDHAGAETLQREALALRRKLLGNDHPDVAWSLDGLATVLRRKGEAGAAEALYREAITIRRKALGDDHPHVAYSLAGLADTLCRVRRAAEAESLARGALAILTKALPHGHVDIAEAESILGGCLAVMRRHAEAEVLLVQSYPVVKGKRGERSVEAREALERTVRLYDGWGKPDKAGRYRAELTQMAVIARP